VIYILNFKAFAKYFIICHAKVLHFCPTAYIHMYQPEQFRPVEHIFELTEFLIQSGCMIKTHGG
jgi:hypothetical protein